MEYKPESPRWTIYRPTSAIVVVINVSSIHIVTVANGVHKKGHWCESGDKRSVCCWLCLEGPGPNCKNAIGIRGNGCDIQGPLTALLCNNWCRVQREHECGGHGCRIVFGRKHGQVGIVKPCGRVICRTFIVKLCLYDCL